MHGGCNAMQLQVSDEESLRNPKNQDLIKQSERMWWVSRAIMGNYGQLWKGEGVKRMQDSGIFLFEKAEVVAEKGACFDQKHGKNKGRRQGLLMPPLKIFNPIEPTGT